MRSNRDTSDQVVEEIVLILPAFNEEQTIGHTIEEFFKVDPTLFFLIVNNNSTDKTELVAKETLSNLGVRGRIVNETRQGKGFAIRRAFSEIDAEIYVMTDADLTYPAKDLGLLIKPIKEQAADMVVGDRHANNKYRNENQRLFHNFGNNLVRKIINILFGTQISDVMSGYRAFSRQFVKNLAIMSHGFELETELTLHALRRRLRIIEIPTDYRDRPKGSYSKLNTYRDGARVIGTIFNILRFCRPLLFFAFIGIFFLLASISAGIPVFIEFYLTGLILHIPLAILATGLMIMAMLTFAIGVILDQVVYLHNFEYELYSKKNK